MFVIRRWIHLVTLPLSIRSFALCIALVVTATHGLVAQTFKVIHTFTNGTDGGYPYAGLVAD